MQIKSILRYPGGKSRAVKILDKYIPSNISEAASPFFGGGSFEFHMASKGIKVYGSDIFTPLVYFWEEAITNSKEIADIVQEYYPITYETFRELQDAHTNIEGTPKQKVAAYFYILNRCSFSGTTYSGGMSKNHPRFTQSSIDRLRNWKCHNIDIENSSFETFIPKHKNKFQYLDPPYYIESFLYGNKGDTHKEFDHIKLRESVEEVSSFVMSYNDCDFIRELYSDFEIVNLKWKYGMGNNKDSSEILIIKKF